MPVEIASVSEGPTNTASTKVDPAMIERQGHVPRMNGESGRPYIWLPDHSKRKYYSRPSGLGSTLEDKEGLMRWGERMVLDGIFRTPTLLEQYAKMAAEPNFNPSDAKWKPRIQELAEQAKQIANAMSKADIGTALHDITEALDHGRDPGWIPPEFEQLVNAYEKAIEIAKRDHGLEIIATELFMVNDEWEVAGTLDKLMYWEGKLVIGDSKTSGTLQYSKGKFCIQIDAYRRGMRYSPKDALNGNDHYGLGAGRSPYVPGVAVDPDLGIIIHFASDGTKCEFIPMPLTHGERGFLLTKEIKEWKNFWNRKAQRVEEQAMVSVDGSLL